MKDEGAAGSAPFAALDAVAGSEGSSRMGLAMSISTAETSASAECSCLPKLATRSASSIFSTAAAADFAEAARARCAEACGEIAALNTAARTIRVCHDDLEPIVVLIRASRKEYHHQD